MALLKDGTRIYGNAIVDGNIAVSNIYNGGQTWAFAADGSLTLPSGSPINFGPGNALIQAGMGFHIDSEEGISLAAINTSTSTTYGWGFGTDGNLTLPAGSTIGEGTTAISGGPTVNNIELTPYGGGDPNQRLVIYPTAVEGNHVHLTSGNLQVTDIFLGDDAQFVKTNTDGSMAIGTNVGPGGSGGNVWTFGTDGTTTFPHNTIHINNNITVQASGIPATVTAITYSSGGWDSVSGSNLATTGGTGSGLTVDVSQSGSGYADSVIIVTPGNGYTTGDTITATSGGASVQFTISVLSANWTFSADGDLMLPTNGNITAGDSNVHIAGNIVLGSNGNIVFPDSTVQTSAYQAVRSAYNTQYPSVHINNAQFNIDSGGNPTVGALAGSWSGGYTVTWQTAAGSYTIIGSGSATATWTSVASYGFGVTFGAAGDRATGLFSDDTNGHQYRVTWVAGSGGPSTGYGFIEVEQLI